MIFLSSRVYNIVSSKPNFTLILLHVISIPLTGKLKCYGYIVKRLTVFCVEGNDSKLQLTISRGSWDQQYVSVLERFPPYTELRNGKKIAVLLTKVAAGRERERVERTRKYLVSAI